MRQGTVRQPHLSSRSRISVPTDAEVFRSPLLVSCDSTESDRVKALQIVRRELGESADGVAKMLGLVPA